MTGRRVAFWALALVVVVVLTTLFARGGFTASSSTLSVGPQGWFLARRYLEARGRETSLLDSPLVESSRGDVLLVAFPWQRVPLRNDLTGIRHHLLRGGTLVFAFSGQRVSPGEEDLLELLGLSYVRERESPPINPMAWYRFVTEEWNLTPASPSGVGAAPVVISTPYRIPGAPETARVLLNGPGDVAVAYSFPFSKGTVMVLPAEAFANARLRQPGNANLLESVGMSLGRHWVFDEYHHGLSSIGATEGTVPRLAFDLILVHLILLYAAVAFRLGRRFGPAWREMPVVSGSTSSFLVGLGGVHHRLGHHAEASRLLVERAKELQPRLALPEISSIGTPSDFVALAKAVARAQEKR